MPYTPASLALVWVVITALAGLTASRAASGPWLVLVALAALATPALRRRSALARPIPIRDPAATPVLATRRRATDLAADLLRWENEGGAA